MARPTLKAVETISSLALDVCLDARASGFAEGAERERLACRVYGSLLGIITELEQDGADELWFGLERDGEGPALERLALDRLSEVVDGPRPNWLRLEQLEELAHEWRKKTNGKMLRTVRVYG